MTTDPEAEAKAMYFEYACHTFFMAHDGVFAKYQAYGISEGREREWRAEFIAYWVSSLSTDDMTALNWLRNSKAVEALPDLLRMAGEGDSYAKLWFANSMWDIAKRALIPAPMRDAVARTAVGLWASILRDPIEISDSHKKGIDAVIAKGALDASTPEEYIQNYARKKLDELAPSSS
jgi:hypothetical protein